MKLEMRGDNELVIVPETQFETNWLIAKSRSAFIKTSLYHEGDRPVLKIEMTQKYVKIGEEHEQSS